jgi:hypothetical protein
LIIDEDVRLSHCFQHLADLLVVLVYAEDRMRFHLSLSRHPYLAIFLDA